MLSNLLSQYFIKHLSAFGNSISRKKSRKNHSRKRNKEISNKADITIAVQAYLPHAEPPIRRDFEWIIIILVSY